VFFAKDFNHQGTKNSKTKKLCALVSWWLKNWIFITGDSSNGWISVRFLDSFEQFVQIAWRQLLVNPGGRREIRGKGCEIRGKPRQIAGKGGKIGGKPP